MYFPIEMHLAPNTTAVFLYAEWTKTIAKIARKTNEFCGTALKETFGREREAYADLTVGDGQATNKDHSANDNRFQ